MISLRIEGEVPSKKNSYRRGRGGRLYIEQGVRTALDTLHLQLNAHPGRPKMPLEGPVRVVVRVFGAMRHDADNQATTLLDLLQKAGYIKNDKQVVDMQVSKEKSGVPYVEIVITEGSP